MVLWQPGELMDVPVEVLMMTALPGDNDVDR